MCGHFVASFRVDAISEAETPLRVIQLGAVFDGVTTLQKRVAAEIGIKRRIEEKGTLVQGESRIQILCFRL